MATTKSKSVASRIPLELYYEIHSFATEKNMTMSDFICYVLDNYSRSMVKAEPSKKELFKELLNTIKLKDDV